MNGDNAKKIKTLLDVYECRCWEPWECSIEECDCICCKPKEENVVNEIIIGTKKIYADKIINIIIGSGDIDI